MKRFLCVRGQRGVPVTNPHTPNDPHRFVGLKRNPSVAFDPLKHDSPLDLYEPIDEVIADHPDLVKPIRKKVLILVGKAQIRGGIEDARSHFMKVSKVETDKPAQRKGNG